MKLKIIPIPCIVLLITYYSNAQDLDVLHAGLDQSFLYDDSVEQYQNDFWWTMNVIEVGETYSSDNSNNESIRFIGDYNLRTSYKVKNTSQHLEIRIGFKVQCTKVPAYLRNDEFKGEILIFNGDSKSMQTWKETSRAKTLKVFHNDKAICLVKLKNSWRSQTFSIERFFKNLGFFSNSNAPYTMKYNDKLTFQILDFYPGENQGQIAISEILAIIN